MFGDLHVNDKGWMIAPFSEFAKIDAIMTTDYEEYADYPHIGIDSIESVTGELKGYRTVKQDGVKSGKYIFTPAHIIYSKIRPNLNKVALPTFEGLCSADAYPILNNSDIYDRVFLAYVLRSELFLSYVLPFSYRTNFPKVNREQISGFSMPLPPLPLQTRFAEFVRQADKSKFNMQRGLDVLEFLYKSLMQKCFREELFNG
jgi:type I restriction enzyme S subunit